MSRDFSLSDLHPDWTRVGKKKCRRLSKGRSGFPGGAQRTESSADVGGEKNKGLRMADHRRKMEDNALRLMVAEKAAKDERHRLLSDHLEAEKERRRLLAEREKQEREMKMYLEYVVDKSEKRKLEDMLRAALASKVKKD
ncbi:hypothetical protein BaRGS_00022800 [Batillaria attramentaria]|uniref:Uncharacterized protein n=1 Tax=Batillaria attramentaria TaxID=370345 RepID=A0ABD0KFT4_9CAEN